MRWFAVAFLVVVLVAQIVPVSNVIADGGDQSEDLTEEEETYVNKTRAAYANGRAAVAELDGVVDSAALGAFGMGETSTADIVGAMVSCSGKLSSVAQTLRQSPPSSMQSVAETNASVAAVLEGSYSSCIGMMVDEGVDRALDWGRNALGSLFDVPPAKEKSGPGAEAKIVACLWKESGNVKEVLQAGEAVLDSRVMEVENENRQEREDAEELLFEDCFIATAAYGTKSAEEIQVLRDFRDDVLMLSPAGRDFVAAYYTFSPPVADFIARHELLRTLVREGLVNPIVKAVEVTEPLFALS